MSPVRQPTARSPRAIVLGVLGMIAGLALVILLFVVAIPTVTETDTVEVRLGATTFDAGPAEARATEIAERGPVLFPDIAGRQRDVYLQHLGTDPQVGWSAFDARRPGTTRECTLRWVATPPPGHFQDPCDGTVVPADGAGLASYPVEVTEEGSVVVDFGPADPGGEVQSNSSRS